MNLNSEHIYYSKKVSQDLGHRAESSWGRILGAAILLAIVLLSFAGTRIAFGKVGYAAKIGSPSERKNGIGMNLVGIPGGRSFRMGSPGGESERDEDEGPQRDVSIKSEFWMGMYEVTQDEWAKVMGSNPSAFCNCGR